MVSIGLQFKAQDHLALINKHDLVDLKQAALVSGARFYYLKNEGVTLPTTSPYAVIDINGITRVWCIAALLELALINWAVQRLIARGYAPVLPPDLVSMSPLFVCLLSNGY
jgi:seryl-tRNA synthetase